MAGIGIKDIITVDGNRQFHIHTGTDPQHQEAISEVFESGKYIYNNSLKYTLRGYQSKNSIDHIKKVTQGLHENVMDELEVLFTVNEKIKLIRQYLPHYRLGSIFSERNFYEEAIENFERCIKINPDFISAYKRLAIVYLKQHEYVKAEDELLKAHQLKPEYPDILNLLGVVSTLQKKYKEAKDYFQKALQINPAYKEANYNFGVVLLLSTVNHNNEDEQLVIPARIMRSLASLRDHKYYSDEAWQEAFNSVSEKIEKGGKSEILNSLLDLQFRIAVKKNFSEKMYYFFLKFMYGGRDLTREELDYYEDQVKKDAIKHGEFADYWNELGIIHLVQCRDYFLKSLSEFDKAVKNNVEYESAKKTLDLLQGNKNGFLILLRAILR